MSRINLNRLRNAVATVQYISDDKSIIIYIFNSRFVVTSLFNPF
jgi:hypothetical protein